MSYTWACAPCINMYRYMRACICVQRLNEDDIGCLFFQCILCSLESGPPTKPGARLGARKPLFITLGLQLRA